MKKIISFMLLTITSGQSFGQLPKGTEIVKVNGINMYYEVYGEGEPLLFLHGWTQSSEFWTEYIPLKRAFIKTVKGNQKIIR